MEAPQAALLGLDLGLGLNKGVHFLRSSYPLP
jgi:hypothetical protein